MRLALALLLVAALAFAFRGALLRQLGRSLVVADEPAPADAIVVLAGSLPDRILYGVDLYKAGMAPLLVLTREPELPGLEELRSRGLNLPERFELTLSIAEQLGVPRAAIVLIEPRADSTINEIASLLPELRQRGLHSLLLVTSKTHARRAAAIFRALAGNEFAMRVTPTPYDPFSADDWWQHRGVARRVLTEYSKWAMFSLIDRWRIDVFLERGGRP